MPLTLKLTDAEDAAITKAALEDPDCPPLTDSELATMRPAIEVVPEIVQQYRRFKTEPRVAKSIGTTHSHDSVRSEGRRPNV